MEDIFHEEFLLDHSDSLTEDDGDENDLKQLLLEANLKVGRDKMIQNIICIALSSTNNKGKIN